MSRRFLFLISDQHFIPAGGIGTFALGFNSWVKENNDIVDVGLDKPPRTKLISDVNYFYPDFPLKYSDHQSYFFYRDGINLERVINFKESILKASKECLYDLIVCNTPEAALACYILGLHHLTKVVYYTHLEYLTVSDYKRSSVFNQEYLDFYRKMMETDFNMIVGTQTTNNVNIIQGFLPNSDNVLNLPLFLPQEETKYSPPEERSGVLFIGRYEDRKNPAIYLDMIEQTGLPARVLTNTTGKRKFETEFESRGISDYQIECNIRGVEKTKFIQSCRIAFHPSKVESFGYCVMETLSIMPTFVLKDTEWVGNFEKTIKIDKDDYESIKECYEKYLDYSIDLDMAIRYNNDSAQAWEKMLSEKVEFKQNKNKIVSFIENSSCITINDILSGTNQKGFYQDTLKQIYHWYQNNLDNVKQTERTLIDNLGLFHHEEASTLEDFLH